MEIDDLLKRQQELTPLMIENSNFGLLKAKKDPSAQIIESTYYKLQSEFNTNRIKINEILNSQKKITIDAKITSKKEYREITSLTYIKAQSRFSRNFDRYFKR